MLQQTVKKGNVGHYLSNGILITPRTKSRGFQRLKGPVNSDFFLKRISCHDAENGMDIFVNDKLQSLATQCANDKRRRKKMEEIGLKDSLTMPIVQTSAYFFDSSADLLRYQEDRLQYGCHSFAYGRYGNPTVRACEKKLAELEGGEDCVLSCSGMTSIMLFIMSMVTSASQERKDVPGIIVSTNDCYRKTRGFLQQVAPLMGVQVKFVSPGDLKAVERSFKTFDESLKTKEGSWKIFFSESLTNPYVRCIDIPAHADICERWGAIMAIDATFSTPVVQKCLTQGADVVIHSATKYLGGHNDLLSGCLIGDKEIVDKVRAFQDMVGGILDPNSAYLLIRGIKTLDIRMQRHCENAQILAAKLECHPAVIKVHYPGLTSHKDHSIAKSLLTRFGGMLSFELRGDFWETARFLDRLDMPYIAPSLGGTETLIEQPALISYFDKTEQERREIGILDNLIRCSVGLEDVNELWHDIKRSLDMVQISCSL